MAAEKRFKAQQLMNVQFVKEGMEPPAEVERREAGYLVKKYLKEFEKGKELKDVLQE